MLILSLIFGCDDHELLEVVTILVEKQQEKAMQCTIYFFQQLHELSCYRCNISIIGW